MKIYTKTGDSGETHLLFGGRVSKTDLRCEAYGSTDLAVSAMGLARGLSQDPKVKNILLRVQNEMFIVGAELATEPSQYQNLVESFKIVTEEMVLCLETLIDELAAEFELPNAFIVPGASTASGALDVARSQLRTAERRVVELKEHDLLVNPEVLRYMNRLADLLFMLARYEDRDIPMDVLTDLTRRPK
ncbi:cob(I)yrinic acid a,c-diamide adenosyltransferase [Dehalococcoidia bacterium]|nr:cob(I)yrinic acid a,c-diamide adenosyltransferase [Dehalococcoidia bacterium]